MLLVVATGSAMPATGLASSPPYVPCAEIIGQASGPRVAGYRLVLGVLSVPPAYSAQGAARVHGFGLWTHWRKAPVLVRGGRFIVTVTVPNGWRSRAAISWGSGVSPIASSVRFSGCGPGAPTSEWNAYAGGFYLRSLAACIPLSFQVGKRVVTERFGIGTRCR